MAWKHSVAAVSSHLYMGGRPDLGPCLLISS